MASNRTLKILKQAQKVYQQNPNDTSNDYNNVLQWYAKELQDPILINNLSEVDINQVTEESLNSNLIVQEEVISQEQNENLEIQQILDPIVINNLNEVDINQLTEEPQHSNLIVHEEDISQNQKENLEIQQVIIIEKVQNIEHEGTIIEEEIASNSSSSDDVSTMSADSFHHMVEKSLKTIKKVYDFNDYKIATENTKAKVIEMSITDFALWKDHSKKYKAKDPEKVYLHDIVQDSAIRGDLFLNYRTDFEKPALSLDFLKKGLLKTGKIPSPEPMVQPRGISKHRRDGIIKLIEGKQSIIPLNRLDFWKNIPVSDNI